MSAAKIAADGIRARKGGPWTRDKLRYLEKYASAFMTAMAPKRAAGRWEKLVYIDPLCGPGVVIDAQGNEFRGSPLIAINTTPTFDRVFLGDASRLDITALRKRIPADAEGRVSLERKDCHERARDVIREVSRKTLALAFVDPEGFEVGFELFRTLAQRNVDILFLFPSGIGIARNLRAFARSADSPMDRLWGSRQWRETPIARLLAGSASLKSLDANLDENWVRGFCDRVGTLGYRSEAVGPLRNEQNVPMYHLVFFCRHDAGLIIWRGIGKITPRGQRLLDL